MLCSSCNKQKADLHPRKSRLITSMTLFLCGECTKANMEPRFVIVLHGRQHGPMSVADYITRRRYVGDEILAKEVLSK
jgi:hypothetical protein